MEKQKELYLQPDTQCLTVNFDRFLNNSSFQSSSMERLEEKDYNW